MSNISKTQLLKKVDAMIGVPNNTAMQDDHEIEARIGEFRGNRFVSNVQRKTFFRILDHFLTHTPSLYNYLRQPDSIKAEQMLGVSVPSYPDIVTEAAFFVKSMKIRESFIHIEGLDTPRTYASKRPIANVDMKDYFTRFAVSREQDIITIYNPAQDNSGSPIPEGQQPEALRIKHRWSFALVSDDLVDHPLYPYRVDLTHVTGWSVNRNGKRVDINSYEVELEVINTPITNAQNELWPGVQFMLELVQATPFPVSAPTLRNVTDTFNELFSEDITRITEAMQKKKQGWRFPSWKLFNIVNKPVNLKLNVLLNAGNYAVTDKADGERRQMYIREDGAYLLYPPSDIMRYLRLETEDIDDDLADYTISAETAKALAGTVFDGELVLRDDGKREYLIFDLIVDRQADLRKAGFKDRIKRANEIVAEHDLNATVKTFYFPDANNFYDNVRTVLEEVPTKPYGNDGLIFNGVNDYYSRARIYKWKPPTMLTIDFLVRQSGPTTFDLYLKNDRGGKDKYRIFEGTERDPNSGVININPPEIDGTPITDGQIVEMSWNYEQDTFVPFRVRFDRDEPNNYSVGIDVWKDIMKPITEDTITGKDIKAVRLNQNNTKNSMLKEHCRQSVILDIGGGKGGDQHKWKHLGNGVQILSVEPNEENLAEFNRRLEESDYKLQSESDGIKTYTFKDDSNSVELAVYQARGQDTNKIVEAYAKSVGANRGLESVHCVTMFNVLTFFFDKQESLDSLINTIDELLQVGGVFMGIVMDGSEVREQLVRNSALKEELRNLGDDQYWNLDTKKRVNKKFISKLNLNKKWRIVSKNKSLLNGVVKGLELPNPNEIKGESWTIKKTSNFTNSPYGNQINIDLGEDTIVKNQTEYLVDFNELVVKLKARGIMLRDTTLLTADNGLSPQQQKLNSLYRTFVFEKEQKAKTTTEKVTVMPLTGVHAKTISTAESQANISKAVIQMAQATLDESTDELNKLEAQIIAYKKSGTKISANKAMELAKRRNELKKKIADAKAKISAQQKRVEEAEKVIADEKQEIAALKPKQIILAAAKEKKTSTKKPAAKKMAAKNVVMGLRKLAKKVPVTASGEIKTTVKVVNNNFAAVDYEEFADLNVEDLEDVNIGGVDLVRIGTIDNRCITAAILRAAFKQYIGKHNEAGAHELTEEQRKIRKTNIAKVNNKIIATLEKQFKANKLGRLNKYYNDWDSAKDVVANCANWQWLGIYPTLAQIFKVNLVIATADNPFIEPIIYRTPNNYDHTVALYNHNGHFEVLAQRDADNNLVTKYPSADITIKSL